MLTRPSRSTPRWTPGMALAAGLLAGMLAADPALAVPPPTFGGCAVTPEADAEGVTVQTPLGPIEIELFSNAAPATVANLLGYISRGDYADTVFHRNLPGFVIQAGGYRLRDVFFEPIDTQPTVDNEPCISNVKWTVAMAKLPGQPDSATSQWFINLEDNSALDGSNGGFTAFGRVVSGKQVAIAISQLDTVPLTPNPLYFAAVQSGIWDRFRETPLTAPLDLGRDHGCFDVDESGVVLVENPANFQDLEPNDDLGLSVTLASTACETSGGSGAGSPIDCQDPGRIVLYTDPASPGLVVTPDPTGGPGGLGYEGAVLSCGGLAASGQSYTARLEDFGDQFRERMVFTTYTVPEPGAGAAALCALLALTGLRRASPTRRR